MNNLSISTVNSVCHTGPVEGSPHEVGLRHSFVIGQLGMRGAGKNSTFSHLCGLCLEGQQSVHFLPDLTQLHLTHLLLLMHEQHVGIFQSLLACLEEGEALGLL